MKRSQIIRYDIIDVKLMLSNENIYEPWSSQFPKFGSWSGFISYDLMLIILSLVHVVLLIFMVNYAIILWIVGDVKEWWYCLLEEGKLT